MRTPRSPLALVLALSVSLVPAQPGPGQGDPGHAGPDAGRNIESLARASSAPAHVRIDAVTGFVTALRGRFEAPGFSPEEAARAFLARHAPAFGLPAGLESLRPGRSTRDAGGAVITLEQHHRGVPVIGGAVLVGFDTEGRVIHVRNRHVPALDIPIRPEVSAMEALDRAEEHLGSWLEGSGSDPELVVVEGGRRFPGHRLAWKLEGSTQDPPGDWWLFVDAGDGQVVRTVNHRKFAGGTCTACNPDTNNNCGSIFFYDPIIFFDDPSLREPDNVDGAQVGCTLAFKTSPNFLDGTYANTGPTSPRTTFPFNKLRSVDEEALDEVTAFYHATRAKQYLNSLGYPGVMNFSIGIDAHDPGAANAFYTPVAKEIHFGISGVDYAQDPGVICHEYGHAIQDNQVSFFGITLEGGSMGEGFGDYWAGALMEDDWATLLGPECLAPWATVNFFPYTGPGTGCLRRLDKTKQYPANRVFTVHSDGEIWSSALWELRNAVGGTVADKLVIKAHTFLLADADFIDGADALHSADAALYGGAHTAQIEAAFISRGIPRTGTAAATTDMTQSSAFVCETAHDYAPGESQICSFTQPGASRLRLHFSRMETESGFDFLHISNADYHEVQKLSGSPFGAGNPGYSAAVTGSTIVARFKADGLTEAHGFTTDFVEYAVGAGQVPDGNAMPGTPLNISEGPTGDITLTWGTSCAPGDTDFQVYEGTIGSWESHLPVTCSTGNLTTATFTPAAGSSYYLVVPRNAIGEGSYGTRSDGTQRPASTGACLPQELAVICN